MMPFNIESRKQFVKSNEKSDQEDVASRVSQGSKFGPLFFLIFKNDLPEAILKLGEL